MKTLLKLVVLFSLLNINCQLTNNETESNAVDRSENRFPNYILFSTEKCHEIIDSLYTNAPKLAPDSKKEDHCNWIQSFNQNVSDEILKYFGKNDGIYTLVGYTRMNDETYVNFYNGECRVLNDYEVSESVTGRFNKNHKCVNPNDPKLIKPEGRWNSISKYYPKTQGVENVIALYYKGDGEKIIYKKE